jgi:hypothetical protein
MWFFRLIVLLLSIAAPVSAGAFEAPPVTKAEQILGPEATGPNYRVDPEVRSDGLLHLFTIHTAFGSFEVAGDDLVRTRIRELGALRKLQAMSETDVFAKSLGEAAAAPLKYGADLLTDPAATLKKSVSGVANLFGRVSAGLSNSKANRDNVLTSILGVDSARRALAVQLGVDPYTDFPPLASKLNDVASAAAFGGLTVKGLMMVIPGGAGVAVSSASTVDTVRATLLEKTSAQIAESVMAGLLKARVPRATAERLVQNRMYTPADLLILSKALASLKAQNTALFVARAAGAATREEAVFQRRRAELLASNANSMGIGPFVDVAGFPLNRLKDGRLLALFPLDEVAWTEGVAGAFSRMAEAASGEASSPVLAVTGTLTTLADAEVARAGWSSQRVR